MGSGAHACCVDPFVVRVLVALDETPRAAHVLDVALQVVEHLGGVAVPFRAVQVPPEFPPAAATSHRDELPAHLVAEATHALERLVANAPAGRVAAPVVRIGQPWRAIVEVADEQGVDLIVIGSHGYHGLDRLLGTVSRHVADAAHHDVLIAHDESSAADVRSILIALRGSPRDGTILARGLAVAHAWRAAVHLVRVVRISRAQLTRRRAVVGYVDAARFESTQDLSRFASSDPAVASAFVAFSVGPAWRALVETAEEVHADLIVVGSHEHRRWDAVGRTATGHVADEAHQDVLVVHEPSRAAELPAVNPAPGGGAGRGA